MKEVIVVEKQSAKTRSIDKREVLNFEKRHSRAFMDEMEFENRLASDNLKAKLKMAEELELMGFRSDSVARILFPRKN